MLTNGQIKILLTLKSTDGKPINQSGISKKTGNIPKEVCRYIKTLKAFNLITEIDTKARGKHFVLSVKGVRVAVLLEELQELLR